MYTPEQIKILIKLGLNPNFEYSYQAKEKLSCWDNPIWIEIQKVRSNTRTSSKKPYSEKSKAFKILGCNFVAFRQHIEKQFLKGMNWENQHLWHLDHIIPLSSAKTIDDVHVLSKFTNLRPIWAIDNRKKKAKILHLI